MKTNIKLNLAKTQYQNGNLESAQKICEEIHKSNPDQIDVLYILSVIELQKKIMKKHIYI